MTIQKIRWAGVGFLAVNAVCNFVHADETPQPPFRLGGLYSYFGFEGGVNFASLTNTNSNAGSHTGFQTGVNLDVPFTPYFSLMPAVRFSQRGFSFNNVYLLNGSGPYSGDATLNYVEVPIRAKVSFRNGSDVTPFAFFGPCFSFKTGVGGSGTTNGGATQEISDSNGEFNTFDFGLDFGVGPEFQLNQTTRMFIDFEYYLGLTDIESGVDSKNTVPQINVGFSWAL